MVVATLEEIMEAVQQLRPEEQAALAQSLQLTLPSVAAPSNELTAGYEIVRAAGEFEGDERLLVCPKLASGHQITDADLLAAIEDLASEWEPDDGDPLAPSL